jgi:hypothetical protein
MNNVLLVVTAVVLVLLALRVVVWLFAQRSVETLDFRGPVRALDVAVSTGEVTVRGTGRRDARVRRVMRHGLRRPRIEELVEDGVLKLRVPSGVVLYEIDVPASAAVHVEGDSATTTVIGVGGPVQLRAAAGSLEGRALVTPTVHAVTTVGSIRLVFDRAPDVIDVTTRKGSVELVLPDGDTDIRTHTPGPVRILPR